MGRHYGILVLFFSAFLGCQDTPPTDNTKSAQSTLAQVKAKGTIRVGYANEAPYAYYDPEQDRLTGEAPEIARHVFKEMGIAKIEGILTEFGALIPGLKAKRFDVIAAGMYITPKRCKEVAFSNPTYGIGEGFIVQNNNPKNLHSYEDIANHDTAKLGVVTGTVEISYSKALGIPETRLMIFPDAIGALAGVQTSRIDAFAATSLTIQTLINKANDGSIERAKPFRDPVINGKEIIGYGAFALRKEDKDLIQALNKGLAVFLGSKTHQEMVHPFGFTGQELPGNITAEELCALTTIPDQKGG
ncbi:MAG: ectoine/hydroxyectoine ABC transporter substrate-binding protein EhuB [Nitrospinales bacterium]